MLHCYTTSAKSQLGTVGTMNQSQEKVAIVEQKIDDVVAGLTAYLDYELGLISEHKRMKE